MVWMILNCPQCAAPLPRQALWKSAQCSYCGVLVSKTETTVLRDSFRSALQRQRANGSSGSSTLRCNGQTFAIKETLFTSADGNRFLLGQRVGAAPIQVLLKLGDKTKFKSLFSRESRTLAHFHSIQSAAAGYYSRLIPNVVEMGDTNEFFPNQTVIVLGLVPGLWGSLSSVLANHTNGVDVRHAVWMWRRVLEMLAYIHSAGWTHGDLSPEMSWVSPRDHGVHLMNWTKASSNANQSAQSLDIQNSARLVQVVLTGAFEQPLESLSAPKEILDLLSLVINDADFCYRRGARGIDELLVKAARNAFGAPKFLEFKP
jgi:serine/threonine protein kinase